jgi:glycosyltransferase involved in cell wall biosynthesis
MIILYVFVFIPFLVSLYNLATFPRLRKGIPKDRKLVSVIIPARNEENSISNCIQTIIDQTYDNLEIIVIDDNSTDKTYEIAKKFKEVKVISGEKLKTGWRGKNWACYQGYKHSRGDYLLFIDADVRLGNEVISDAVFHIESTNVSLLSIFPVLTSNTFFGQLSVNNLKWLLLSFLPLNLVKLSQRPEFNAAIGQFMLFKRDAYEDIDGHQGIKAQTVEDLALGYKMKSSGKSIDVVLGTPQDLACLMYPDLKSSVNGLGRSLAGSNSKVSYARLSIVLFSFLPFVSHLLY